MNATHLDPDRIADQSPGAPWTEAEAAHLSGCADCRREVELVASVRSLGLARLAGFDADRVAARVRSGLATRPVEAPGRAPWRAGRWLVGLAAAAGIVLAVRLGTPAGQLATQGPSAPVLLSVLHELDGLTTGQLELVLQSIPPATEALDHVEMAPLGDLSTTDLERMLQGMEEP